MRLARRSLPVLLGVLIAPRAFASWQSCGGQALDETEIRCPDGSIPNFEYGDPPVPVKRGVQAEDGGNQAQRFPWVGVWHTREEGLGQSRVDDIPGASTLGMGAGLRAGDLTLAPNGAFVWNRLRATWGRWIPAQPPWQIVMYDSSGTQRWLARVEQSQLRIEQSGVTQFGTR